MTFFEIREFAQQFINHEITMRDVINKLDAEEMDIFVDAHDEILYGADSAD